MESLKTLQEAIVYFSNPDNCVSYMVSKRWKDGVVICPNCGSKEVKYMPTRRVWQCKTRHPKSQFSVKVGSIYEDSALGLDKWLTATWMVANCKNGVSSYEIARNIGVTQKSAWFMLHRIRTAMTDTDPGQLGYDGPVEIDETFIGGKVKNMHQRKRPHTSTKGGYGKTIVLGMLERGGKVRAKSIEDRLLSTVKPNVIENIAAGAHIITDQHAVYPFIARETYYHDVINHLDGYVRGHIHTNGIENFWSLLKRGLSGTYISVRPFHLDRYVAEQVFRYNNRKDIGDKGRLGLCVAQGFGKRLTYKELTGRD